MYNYALYIWLNLITLSYPYVNVALNKPAYQQYPYKLGDHRFDASNAVDRLKSVLRPDAGECVLSAWKKESATLWINLTTVLSIHHITIYYMTGQKAWGPDNQYKSSFLGFSVYVSKTPDRLQGTLCFKDKFFTKSTIPAVYTTTCPVHGQYVIFYNERLENVTYPEGYSNFAFNELCEMEVFGCPSPGYFGSNCSIPCPDLNCQFCHIQSGTCQGCKPPYVYCDNRCKIESSEDSDWEFKFYCIFGAFCLLLLVFGILIVFITLTSLRKERKSKIKHHLDNSSDTKNCELPDVSCIDVNTSEYQEVDEQDHPGIYSSLQ